MFKFLKDKLKDAVSKFSTKVDEEAETEEVTQEVEESVEDKVEEKDILPTEEEKADDAKDEPTEESTEEEKEEPDSSEEKTTTSEETKEEEPIEEQPEESEQEKAEEKPVETEEVKEEPTPEPEVKSEPEVKEEEPIEEQPEATTEEETKVVEEKPAEEEKSIETEQHKAIEKELEENITLDEEPEKEVETTHPESEQLQETITQVEHQPEEKPKGFFSKIKKAFSKEETVQPVEVKVTSAVKEDIKELEEEAETQEYIEKEVEVNKEEFKEEAEAVDEKVEEPKEEVVVEKPEVKEEPVEEKKGFFSKITQTITTKKLSEDQFNDLFWELEMAMLENSVAVEVIEKIKADLKEELVNKPISRKEIETTIINTLQRSIEELFELDSINLIENVKKKNAEGKPYVICFVGINGSGKTTSIAKVAHMLKKQGLEPVLAASDTFRAAAIDQLQHHADKIDVKIIKHDYNSDPAAVAFDAVKHAEAAKKQVVLIDTAGRLHSNANLMEELHKIVKVAKPDLTLFVGESITGNDCIEQAQAFNKMTDIDGIILSKADIDEKGGAAISISYVLKKPIVYFGVGQEYDDLRPFSLEFIQKNLAF